MSFGFGFGLMSTIIPIMSMLIFVIVIGIFIFTAATGLKTWNKNNNSPRLTVDAKVVAKRVNVSHHMHHDANDTGMHHTHSSTSYYVTFEVESGDRLEFFVSGREYGMIAEGDFGKLSFQGTRFLEFNRINR